MLPDVTAAPHVARRELRPLPVVPLAPIAVFAARHRGALGRQLGQATIAAVRSQLAAIASAPGRRSGRGR